MEEQQMRHQLWVQATFMAKGSSTEDARREAITLIANQQDAESEGKEIFVDVDEVIIFNDELKEPVHQNEKQVYAIYHKLCENEGL